MSLFDEKKEPYMFMANFIEPRESKNFKLIHRIANTEDVARMKSSNFRNWAEYRDFREGTYVILKHRTGGIIMSDTPMEVNTNYRINHSAYGKILIAGLGIGMVLMKIQDNPNVKEITIIEREKEIIDLVASQLPLNNKVRIINSDIFLWRPEKGTKYDVIYFDIWDNICSDNYEEMKYLHRQFRKYLKKKDTGAWMDSWRKEDCRDLYFEDSLYSRESGMEVLRIKLEEAHKIKEIVSSQKSKIKL